MTVFEISKKFFKKKAAAVSFGIIALLVGIAFLDPHLMTSPQWTIQIY